MPSEKTTPSTGEYTLISYTVRVFAPYSMDDNEGEQLFNQLKEAMDIGIHDILDPIESELGLRTAYDS